jgi:uncharacterized protein
VQPDADVRGRIADMLEAIDRIASCTRDHDAGTFADSGMARDAVVWNLTVLGEAVRGVPEEVQVRHPEIPWAKLRGLRGLLVDEDFGIADQIVWTTSREP